MKKFYILVAMLLLSVSAFAQNGRSLYNKYSDYDNVEAVYISPAMFRLIGKIPDLKIEDSQVDLSPIIRSLSGLYMIDSQNPGINAAMQADVEHFVAAGKYELLMEANDSGEQMRMYSIGDEKTVSSFVMLAVDGDETTFLCLDGQMDRAQLEKILAEEMKK